MKKYILVFSTLALVSLSNLSLAQEAPATPEALVETLYKNESSVFSPEENKELSARFLTKGLIELLVRDAKRSQEEPGALDFDVLTYSQDESKITKFVTKAETVGDKSTAKASFENLGEKMSVYFLCEKEGGQWKIADVRYEDGTSLVKLLEETP